MLLTSSKNHNIKYETYVYPQNIVDNFAGEVTELLV